MKLIGMLSWYDESIAFLQRTVDDLSSIGITDLVAVDGAYALYPQGHGRSDGVQAQMLWNTTAEHGINLLMYSPSTPWANNEVGKRQFMMELALAIATEEVDWVVPWDADWEIDDRYREDMKPILAELHPWEHEWADLQITPSPQDAGWYWIRQFIRARRGIHFTTNHYTYHYPDGRRTVVGPNGPDLNSGYKTKIRVWHKREGRSKERLFSQASYYQTRHIKGVEK